jgi:hypothetical protein
MSKGFDDNFNDGVFRASLRTTRQSRPNLWPKSVSEMRRHTFYGGQGMSNGHDTGHCDYMVQRPYSRGQQCGRR